MASGGADSTQARGSGERASAAPRRPREQLAQPARNLPSVQFREITGSSSSISASAAAVPAGTHIDRKFL